MTKQPDDVSLSSRRKFLKTAVTGSLVAAGAGGALAQQKPVAAIVGNPKNLPPNVPSWTQVLGDGVAANPYGRPSKFEKHVVRRDVEWLTASRESSINFTPLHELDGIITPSGLCFERHHGGAAEINPVDYRLMIHGLVDKPLMFTLSDLKRMSCTPAYR
jgi:sulfane dehydrogenase subunit SoxC